MFVVTASLVGKALKERREGAGLTQAQLGALVDVSGSAVGQWEQERTRPGWKQLQRLADVFGVTVVAEPSNPAEWGPRLDAIEHGLELQREVLERIAELDELVSRRVDEVLALVSRRDAQPRDGAGGRPR